MKWLAFLGFGFRAGCIFGQGAMATPDAPIWLMEAWEAECVSLEEVALLVDMGQAEGATQQEVLMHLGTERGLEVLPCLLELSSFQLRLKAAMKAANPREKSSGSVRLGKTFSPDERRGFVGQARILHWDEQGGLWRARLDRSASGAVRHCAGRMWTRDRGQWAVGALAPRFGQGLILWVSTAFDDLGGMEGSHRMPLGLVPAATRLRGVMDGVGWQRHKGGASKMGLAPNWWVIGRIWEGSGWTVALGGGKRAFQWAIRTVPQSDGSWRGLFGFNGRGQVLGWNWRWAWAGFDTGWTGRVSVLRSWTAALEGHAVLAREHAGHPGWHSGEWRASIPDTADGVGWELQTGVAWNENGRGWIRWRHRKGVKPGDFPEQRVSFQWSRDRFRSTVQLDMSDAWPEGFESQWTLRFRWAWEDGDWPDSRWRLHVGASGAGPAKGGVLAVSWAHQSPKGSRWSVGAGQAWGDDQAPLRYVTAWNERPAQPFGYRKGHAFFRHQSRSGQCRIRGSFGFAAQEPAGEGAAQTLQGLSVEFRLD